MKNYQNYWNLRQPPKQLKTYHFDQFKYDKIYGTKYVKLIHQLYDLLWAYLPKECINSIEHTRIIYPLFKDYHLEGFTKKYKGVGRRFILNEDGKWYYTPNLMGWWTNKGLKMTDNVLFDFVMEIKDQYLKEVEKNE